MSDDVPHPTHQHHPAAHERAPTAEDPKLDDELKQEDIALRRVERLCKEKELRSPVWLSPLVVAVMAATLAALGNAVVSVINARDQVALEDRKAEQSRILEMLKTGDPDKAAVNLNFLLSTGLVTDKDTVARLRKFLDERKPGQGPTLASGTPTVGAEGLLSRLWKEREIPVCWESTAGSDPKDRALVQASIANTWQRVSGITFTGWGQCAPVSEGVRIAVADEPPHTGAMGQFVRGLKDGVTLNFAFKKDTASCQGQREHCIVVAAVHEFGHVLGFEHTHDRPDAPPECRARFPGESSSFVLGPYDPHSVMNFCNTTWLNDGILSPGDIAAVTSLYGTRSEQQIPK